MLDPTSQPASWLLGKSINVLNALIILDHKDYDTDQKYCYPAILIHNWVLNIQRETPKAWTTVSHSNTLLITMSYSCSFSGLVFEGKHCLSLLPEMQGEWKGLH